MRVRTTLLALVAASTSLFVTPVAAQADDVQPYIIGGGTVSSAPWSAQIYRNGSFTCSGTIIAARYVLTARHCTGTGMTVRVGSVTRGSGTLVSVSTYSTRYDLAVLTLASAVNTSYMPLASANPPTNSTNSIY